MTEIAPGKNSLDIIVPFNEELWADHTLPEVQLMGGLASVALRHPGTEIRVNDRCIITPADFLEDREVLEALKPVRPNGTRRDMDVLVLSTDPEEIGRVQELADEKIKKQLEDSVFGLHEAAELEEQVAHPFGFQAHAENHLDTITKNET